MELGTGLALFGSAEIVGKLLGPTADYIGEGVKELAQKSTQNVKNIFSIALKKLGNGISIDGAVPPKVLKGILSEGAFCDDPLAAEYFGGVLASSRSGVSRDDRGATLIGLISRLSTYQIRYHYILYHFLKLVFNGSTENPGVAEGRIQRELFIPEEALFLAMDFAKGEMANNIIAHTLFGLAREMLIEDNFQTGSRDILQKNFRQAPGPGLIFQPSVLGIELFLWAYGKPNMNILDFFDVENKFDIEASVKITSGALATKKI